VHQQGAQPRAAQRAAGLDVRHLPHAHRLRAHEPRSIGPAGERDDCHRAHQRGALEDALSGEEQQEQGEAEQHLRGPGDGHVDESAQVAGEDAERESDDDLCCGSRAADPERGARTMQQTREGIAARIVGAERMVRAGRLRQRTFQRGQWRDGVGAMPQRRPERPIRPSQIARAEAAQRPILHQIGKQIERARLPEDDGPVAGDEVREQRQQREQERKAEPDQVPAPRREPFPDAGSQVRRPLSDTRGSAAR